MMQGITIGIVGKGIIGSSWAIVFARCGHPVRIWDRRSGSGTESGAPIDQALDALRGTGLEGDDQTRARITFHDSLEATLEGAGFIQESVAENIEVKHGILRDIEAVAAPDAIIGSSTSGILPSIMASALTRPERFLVVHPLTPPHLLPIVELCAAPATSEQTVDQATALLRAVGQHVVRLIAEIPGFALNRILGAMMNECFALVRDGVIAPDDIDPMLTEGFGLRWAVIGPLAAMDLNAPRGIAEYLRRYGGIFDLVARSRGAEPVLTTALIDALASGLTKPAAQSAAERVFQRDRVIARLRAARTAILTSQRDL